MAIVTIYWILFLLGLGFSVVSAVFAGFGQAAGGHDVDLSLDHDMDLGGGVDTVGFDGIDGADAASGDFYHGHGEIALSPVSPITIAAFIGGFGGGGLIGIELGLTSVWSGVVAMPTGFILAFGIYYLMYLINQSNVSSEARVTEILGLSAEIITPIVEDQIGEIAYNTRGSRYTSGARSLDGRSIAKGKSVKIWRVVGSTCYVKEILPEEVEKPPVDPQDHPGND